MSRSQHSVRSDASGSPPSRPSGGAASAAGAVTEDGRHATATEVPPDDHRDADVEPSDELPAVIGDHRGEFPPLLHYDAVPPELGEALRGIINRWELRTGAPLPKTIAVTSALLGEGVTTVSQSLATLIAQETGGFVCWVDCSWLSADGGPDAMTDRPSLIELLANPSRIATAFQTSPELPQLLSLSPGHVPPARRHMIVRSPEFVRLLGLLCDEFDQVIFDIPPVLSNANALALLRQADVSLIVARHRSTSIAQIERAVEATEPTPNLGVVLNRFQTSIPKRLRRLMGD